MSVSGGTASFTLSGLTAGAHSLVAIYSGDANNGSSTGAGNVTLAQSVLTVTAPTATISYGSAVPAYTPSYAGFVGTDTLANSMAGVPSLITSPATPMNVGAYPITVSQGSLASTNYSFVYVNGLLTISKAATTTALVTSNAAPGQNTAITLTATVASAANGTPTGSVSFYSGTVLLNVITLGSNGTAILNTNFATTGAASITAVYSGDANYATSTSSTVAETTVASGFSLSATPTTLTLKGGTSGTLTLTLMPTGNYQGTAVFSCSGLPSASTCSFTPSTISIAGNNTPSTTQLLIATSVQSSALMPLERRGNGTRLAKIFFLPSLLLAGAIATRRKYLAGQGNRLFLALLLMMGLMSAVGCGTSTPSGTTPTGAYSVNVIANASNGSSTATQQLVESVTITQ
jgi:hypothetical protein